jgi:LPXTG-site transpeptidase (sortase) family protein
MRKTIRFLLIFLIISTLASIPTRSVRAVGVTFYVSPSGNDSNDCLTSATACLTVQAAINKAGTDDIVSVAAGTYNESPRINKNLILQGAGRDVTFINLQTGPTYLGSLSIENPGAEDVTVSGFTIVGRDASCPTLAATNLYVSTGVDRVMIEGNRFRVGNIGACSSGDDGMGIGTYYTTTPANYIQNLTVQDNIFEPVGALGYRPFYINPGTVNFTYSNNAINGNFFATAITQASNGLVEDNTITAAGGSCQTRSALGTWGYPDASVWGHTVFRGNAFTNASGITLFSSSGVTVENNTFNNTNYGVRIRDFGQPYDPNSIEIHFNQFTGVCTYGVSNEGSGVIDAFSNWWGAADGPSGVGGGSGVPVSANVLYDPYCTTPGCANLAPTVTQVNSTPATADNIVSSGEAIPFGITALQVTFSEAMYNPAGNTDPDDVTNPNNYGLLMNGVTPISINNVGYNAATFTSTININSGAPLSTGSYTLTVQGDTSVVNQTGVPLAGNSASVGTDYNLTFSVVASTSPASLPETGFPIDRMTSLAGQPKDRVYSDLGDLWLEIPRLGVEIPITGVPLVDGIWDVTWLGDQAGYLEGTAFPTWAGNSVLTGHVWNADNTSGAFARINTLWWGDKIIIHAWGQSYVYEVRELKKIEPNAITTALKHRDLPWITLLTCKDYNEATGNYKSRVMVGAVLLDVR